LIDVATPADRNVVQNEAEKKFEYKEFMHRDTTNVVHEMCDYSGKNWIQWNNNKTFQEKFGCHARKTFSRFSTKRSYARNITQNTESTAE
jgi:hypothetical protein